MPPYSYYKTDVVLWRIDTATNKVEYYDEGWLPTDWAFGQIMQLYNPHPCSKEEADVFVANSAIDRSICDLY